ncbi:MAG: hypothetical protein E7662_05925 [Ruminococcaceae bacterium]|nr:hypothetical protein [Oscillospiraceae bacterium]
MHPLQNCSFIFENPRTALHLTLENGTLYCIAVENKSSGYRWENPARKTPLLSLPGFSFAGSTAETEIITDDRDGLSAPARVQRILFTKENQQIKLEMRTYENNPFIHISAALRGRFGKAAEAESASLATGIETAKKSPAKAEPDIIFRCPVAGQHFKVRTVTLRDITDQNNILVEEANSTVYQRHAFMTKGQLFFVDAYLADEMMMLAKEAPCAAGRVHDSEYDLRIDPDNALSVSGIGADLSREADYTYDVPLYAVSFAVGKRAELERAWRDYYRLDMQSTLKRGLIAMSNTWGDRNQDAAVCESFMLGEIEQAKKLGVTAVQIDDGWQKGLTANSKLGKGTLWGSGYYASDPDYWTPHPEKFPRGLAPLQKAADEAGLVLGLWFSPDLANQYESWERDAETLLGLHRQYGVRFFKLDGINLTDKLTETRLQMMIRRVHLESGGQITFNFDITALRRWGYLFRREYGNLFVENRYSDWGNYYPHSTLRTVWMLSRYIPTAKLQMEFLNIRRNAAKYEGDPLAPQLYGIDWAYAAVMFACPLYWMEMTNLSEEVSAALADIAAVWKTIAPELVTADVTPVGQEPDGINFTGLRANCCDHGYLLLFRENAPEVTHKFMLPSLSGKRLIKLAGDANGWMKGSTLIFSAAEERSFALFRYE